MGLAVVPIAIGWRLGSLAWYTRQAGQPTKPVAPAESAASTNTQAASVGSTTSKLAELLTTDSKPTQPELAPLPESKVLIGGTQIFQTFNNCGPASLSMALSYFGFTVGQGTLGQELRPYQNPQGDNDDKSVTLEELAAKGEEYGLIAYHRPAGDIELLQQFIAQDIPVVTRTWLYPDEDIGHYRVVKGYDLTTGELIQDDSLQGQNLRYGYQDFLQLWEVFNYEFLVLVPAEKQAVAEQLLGERADERAAWRLALEQAETRLAEVPGDINVQLNRSVALYHLGEYRQSVQAYEAVADRLPGRTLWYQIEPILAYFELGEYDRVLQITQAVFDSQNRAFAELHQLRGLIYQERGQTELAQQEFALAQQYNSANYWLHNL